MATANPRPTRCKICQTRLVGKQAAINHIEKEHAALIPEGWTSARFECYLRTGKTEGKCIYCKKPTNWNPATGKYNRMCGEPACKKKAYDNAQKNYIGKHGKVYSINDPEQQKKMVYGKKSSGTYVFEDEETGKKYEAMYDSSYGRDFFEMIDTFLNWDGADIIAPSPHIYYYIYEGKEHFYIPDAYSTSLNLEIELKDGGDNPNKHPKIQAVDKVKEKLKDDVMASLKGQVNYIKICNKDYSEFFALLSRLRAQDNCPLPKWESKLEPALESTEVIEEGTDSSKKKKLNLIERNQLLTDPMLNYDSLLLYYRNKLFHENLNPDQWVLLEDELQHVKVHLQGVVNGNNEEDKRMNFEAKKALIEVNRFLDYMQNVGPVKESSEINMESVLESDNVHKDFLYHLSREKYSDGWEGHELVPRVPDNYMTKNKYEDYQTKRVCFAPTISQCLTAMSENIKGKTFYVYTASKSTNAVDTQNINPSAPRYVPDRHITGEKWVLKPVKVYYVGTIKVGESYGDGMSYTYGDNKTAELYYWKYDWIGGKNRAYLNPEVSTIEGLMESVKDPNRPVIHKPDLTKAGEELDFRKAPEQMTESSSNKLGPMEIVKRMSKLPMYWATHNVANHPNKSNHSKSSDIAVNEVPNSFSTEDDLRYYEYYGNNGDGRILGDDDKFPICDWKASLMNPDNKNTHEMCLLEEHFLKEMGASDVGRISIIEYNGNYAKSLSYNQCTSVHTVTYYKANWTRKFAGWYNVIKGHYYWFTDYYYDAHKGMQGDVKSLDDIYKSIAMITASETSSLTLVCDANNTKSGMTRKQYVETLFKNVKYVVDTTNNTMNKVSKNGSLESTNFYQNNLSEGFIPENVMEMSMSSMVYFTKEITPESLVNIYRELGVNLKGKVAVKISTGEPGGHNFLQPSLIKDLVNEVKGTIVECNTAYPGKRNTPEEHWKAIKDHGFMDIADCMLMDEHGEMVLPISGGYHLKENYVGEGLKNFDSMIVLSHFKGHTMAGYGGALKNMSIGIASSRGKTHIHTAGTGTTFDELMTHDRTEFQESMADADKSIIEYFKPENIVYINVANNLSVDCDCDAHPHDPEMDDIGIFASTDPVAVDQACIDAVYESKDEGKYALIARIESRNGTHTIDAAYNLGLGNREYNIIDLNANPITENLLFNEKDILYNKEAFDNGDINLCFVIGHSGSGKSTLGLNATKGHEDTVDTYSLDDLQCVADHFTMAQLKEYGELIYAFFSGPGKKFYIKYDELIEKKIPGSEYEDKLYPAFVNFAKGYAKSHKNKKFIIEGVWLFCNDETGNPYFKPEEFKNYAFYIKGTSALVSKFRAAKRDSEYEGGTEKVRKGFDRLAAFSKNFFLRNWKWYALDEKRINVFRNYFKNKPETSVSEATYIEATKKGDLFYPVFILLTYNGVGIEKIIKMYTHDPYSHAAISFDTNLDSMISFNANGMDIENIKESFYKKYEGSTRYSLYMYMASASEYDAMQNFVGELLSRKPDLKYNILGLTNFIFGRGSSREDKFFCSEFVASVIQAGNSKLIKTQPYMTTPYNLIKNRNFIFIKSGILKYYDVKIIDKIIAEKLEEGGFSDVIIE